MTPARQLAPRQASSGLSPLKTASMNPPRQKPRKLQPFTSLSPMFSKFFLASVLWGFSAIPAAEPLDTWQTNFKCGGQTLIVASRCRASAVPMTLNDCQPGQTLSNGVTRMSLPHASPVKGAPALFAITWSCVSVQGRSYVALSYASGQGRGEGDESAEVFDLDLKAISDHALQVEVFRQEATGTHGRIRSIFPAK